MGQTLAEAVPATGLTELSLRFSLLALFVPERQDEILKTIRPQLHQACRNGLERRVSALALQLPQNLSSCFGCLYRVCPASSADLRGVSLPSLWRHRTAARLLTSTSSKKKRSSRCRPFSKGSLCPFQRRLGPKAKALRPRSAGTHSIRAFCRGLAALGRGRRASRRQRLRGLHRSKAPWSA